MSGRFGKLRFYIPKVGRHGLTGRDRDRFCRTWKDAPTLASFLPIRFESGASLDEVTPQYPCCLAEIPFMGLHGQATRPTPQSAILDGVAPCLRCWTWVPFSFIVKTRPLRLEWPDDAGNGWKVAVGRFPHGVLGRAWRWMVNTLMFRGAR